MYEAETRTDTEAASLDERLEQDEAGSLRDALIDELVVAAEAIEAALAGNVEGADPRVLGDLLAAVRSCESIVADVWDAFHRSEGSSKPLHRMNAIPRIRP